MRVQVLDHEGRGRLTCPFPILESFGHRESENGDYLNGVAKCWLIKPEDHAEKIHLSFRTFQTEKFYDALFVFDGATDGGRLLTERTGLFGRKLPAPLTATSGAMLLLFLSDPEVRSVGFSFAWTSTTAAAHLDDEHCAVGCRESQIDDGHCDQRCYNQGCSWDGADCERVCDMATGALLVAMHDPSTPTPAHPRSPSVSDPPTPSPSSAHPYSHWDVVPLPSPMPSCAVVLAARSCPLVCASVGCKLLEGQDGTCDARCVSAGCSYDGSDCACDTKLDEPYGYRSDGSGDIADYAPLSRQCWLLEPAGTHAGKRLSLTFGRFDTEARARARHALSPGLLQAPPMRAAASKPQSASIDGAVRSAHWPSHTIAR